MLLPLKIFFIYKGYIQNNIFPIELMTILSIVIDPLFWMQ